MSYPRGRCRLVVSPQYASSLRHFPNLGWRVKSIILLTGMADFEKEPSIDRDERGHYRDHAGSFLLSCLQFTVTTCYTSRLLSRDSTFFF